MNVCFVGITNHRPDERTVMVARDLTWPPWLMTSHVMSRRITPYHAHHVTCDSSFQYDMNKILNLGSQFLAWWRGRRYISRAPQLVRHSLFFTQAIYTRVSKIVLYIVEYFLSFLAHVIFDAYECAQCIGLLNWNLDKHNVELQRTAKSLMPQNATFHPPNMVKNQNFIKCFLI